MGTRLCHTSQQQLTFVKYGSKREQKAAGVALRTLFERLWFFVWAITVIDYYIVCLCLFNSLLVHSFTNFY